MNDAPLMEAYAELRQLLSRPIVPEGIVTACLGLSECQTKLFSTHLERKGARDRPHRIDDAGAFDAALRLEPSDFLLELLAAIRASEWPRVLVLVSNATHE